ncbi:hypothetical protein GE21DRAFT_1077403 [Neurospora crassa]|nr:hypothetical protein GE21DRAFT_1077403 [Neurospora crassa]
MKPKVPRSVSVSPSTIHDANLLLTASVELRQRGFVGCMPEVHPSKQQDERLLHRPSTPRPQGQHQNGARRKMSRSVLMQPNVLAGPMATRSGIASSLRSLVPRKHHSLSLLGHVQYVVGYG